VSPHFFTGKPRDAESNLDDFGARYFSSQWGRWMSADWTAAPSSVPYATLTNPQSLNLYAYVGNDPIDGQDADGHAQYSKGQNEGDIYGSYWCEDYGGCTDGFSQGDVQPSDNANPAPSQPAPPQDAANPASAPKAQQQGNGNAVPKPDHFTMNLNGWSNPTGNVERGCDAGGCGNYGARRNEGLGATHRGADYLGTVGQDVFAPRTGLISSIGYAYPNSSLRMIHLSTYDGYSIGIGYASPATGIHSGSFVMSGQAIGIMQNVQDVVGGRTPPHIHIQIDFNGTRINPEPLIPAPSF